MRSESVAQRARERMQRRVLALAATLSSCAGPKAPPAAMAPGEPAMAQTATPADTTPAPVATQALEDKPLAWRDAAAPVPATLGRDETTEPAPALCSADEAREVACGTVKGPLCTDPNASLTRVDWTGFMRAPSRADPGYDGDVALPPRAKAPFTEGDPRAEGLVFDAPRTVRYRAPRSFVATAAGAAGALCCYSRCTKVTPGTSSSPPRTLPPDTMWLQRACLELEGAAKVKGCLPSIRRERDFFLRSGSQSTTCCYADLVAIPRPQHHNRGRPLREGDAIRVASLVPATAGRVAATDEKNATRWAEDAAMEHSSIAAFAKLSLDLMALGAPLALVRAAHQAALEEIEHTETALALAEAHGGPRSVVGALPMSGWRPSTLCELIAGTVTDGCHGETVAAIEAEIEAAREDDPVRRSALEKVAREEAGHAELAFRVVAFALAVGGEQAARQVRASCTEMATRGERGDAVAREVVLPGLLALLG